MLLVYLYLHTTEQSEESLNTPIKFVLTIEQMLDNLTSDILMDLIRMKVIEDESQNKLQLLTLASQSCSRVHTGRTSFV